MGLVSFAVSVSDGVVRYSKEVSVLVLPEGVWLGGEVSKVVYAECTVGEDSDVRVVFV